MKLAGAPAPADVLGVALSHSRNLEPEDLAALEHLPFAPRVAPRDSAIWTAGEAPPDVAVLVSGVAARVLNTAGGERQMLGLLLPGDVFDWSLFRLNARLPAAERAAMDHEVTALGHCTLGLVRLSALQAMLEDRPRLAEAFERRAVREQAITREWIINVSARRAHARLGHLLCELHLRLRAMGLANANSFALPLIQPHLAAALGLSNVHLNRAVQRFRAEGLLIWRGGVVTLPELARLQELSEFSADYLDTASAAPGVPALAASPAQARPDLLSAP